MAKRHFYGVDIVSRIRRIQEVIMSLSGIDEFYEIIRLILAKYFAEREGIKGLPDFAICNALLATNSKDIAFSLDGIIGLQMNEFIFEEIRPIFCDISISAQGYIALDQAFEQLTSRHYKADKGQYFTPRHVIDMCIEAIAPQAGELICDPACGSAAFLNSAYSYSMRMQQEPPSLIGFDYSHRACQVARVVALIATDGLLRIEQVDSLKLPDSLRLNDVDSTIEQLMGPNFVGFDAIVTNPPFAGDVSAESFASQYELAASYNGRIERDVLFVERCIKLLREGGRLAIVLPDNKVSSRAFRDMRIWLGRRSAIKAIVSLHRYTFLPYTSQKAAVLFATKLPVNNRAYEGDVKFFRSDKPGKTSNGSNEFGKTFDWNRNIKGNHTVVF